MSQERTILASIATTTNGVKDVVYRDLRKL